MTESNASRMEEVIIETQGLIDTLETLNNEIESYQIAKNNLTDVKDQLQEFIIQSVETNKVIKENFIQVNQLLHSELVVRLKEIKSISEQLSLDLISKSEDMKKGFEQLDLDLVSKSEDIKNGFEQLNLDLISKSEDIKSIFEQSKAQFDNKFKLLFGVAIINAIGIVVLIIATLIY